MSLLATTTQDPPASGGWQLCFLRSLAPAPRKAESLAPHRGSAYMQMKCPLDASPAPPDLHSADRWVPSMSFPQAVSWEERDAKEGSASGLHVLQRALRMCFGESRVGRLKVQSQVHSKGACARVHRAAGGPRGTEEAASWAPRLGRGRARERDKATPRVSKGRGWRGACGDGRGLEMSV